MTATEKSKRNGKVIWEKKKSDTKGLPECKQVGDE
jgi:hypothetical protein